MHEVQSTPKVQDVANLQVCDIHNFVVGNFIPLRPVLALSTFYPHDSHFPLILVFVSYKPLRESSAILFGSFAFLKKCNCIQMEGNFMQSHAYDRRTGKLFLVLRVPRVSSLSSFTRSVWAFRWVKLKSWFSVLQNCMQFRRSAISITWIKFKAGLIAIVMCLLLCRGESSSPPN